MDDGLAPAAAPAAAPVPAPACAVVLHGGDQVSGLADMLHQFLSQILEDDPPRARRAARLRGLLLFRAAEDPEVCVRIDFAGGRVEVADHHGDDAGLTVITCDFVTTAHLTTGAEGPFGLLLSRRLRVRLPWGRGPFLIRALRVMQLPAPPARRRRRLVIAAAVLVAVAAALMVWRLAAPGG